MVRFVAIPSGGSVAKTFGAEVNAMDLITLGEVGIERETEGRL